MSTSRVFAGYRRLFRARKSLFEGDVHAMRESRVAIKQEFLKHAHVQPGPQLEHLISEIDAAADMLLHGFARGDLNPNTNRYEVKLQPQHLQGDESNVTMEPVTPESAAKATAPPKVQVTKTNDTNDR